MADETAINGVDGSVEVFVDSDETEAAAAAAANAKAAQKIEALEQEKRQLVHENDVVRERLEKLKEEIKGLESDKAELKREVEQSVADKGALESISARAHALQNEVSRLQHDLITSKSAEEDAGREVVELRREVEGLKSKVEVLEKERDRLLETVEGRENEVVRLRKVVEEKEVEVERVKKDRENEVREIRKLVEDREAFVAKKELEVERVKKEKDELKVLLEEAEKVKAVVLDGEYMGAGEEKGLKVQWPVVAAAVTTGVAIGAGAVLCYVRSVRER